MLPAPQRLLIAQAITMTCSELMIPQLTADCVTQPAKRVTPGASGVTSPDRVVTRSVTPRGDAARHRSHFERLGGVECRPCSPQTFLLRTRQPWPICAVAPGTGPGAYGDTDVIMASSLTGRIATNSQLFALVPACPFVPKVSRVKFITPRRFQVPLPAQ